MNISRSGSTVALLSVIYAFPCYSFSTGGSSGSSTFTEVKYCSELPESVDRVVCSHHLPIFKNLIREKNNQVSPTTSSGVHLIHPPISEKVRIRKISATTSKLDNEIFATTHPTLFIFDAERSRGKGQPAIYELQLSDPGTGSPTKVSSFQLPDNSAFVGNGEDILPEFVIEGGIQNHYVMSAPHNDSVYYLANIEVDSRNPLDSGSSSTAAATGYPATTPTTKNHIPQGVLDLTGAGIVVADNIKVVLDPADSESKVQPVQLGCTNFAHERGAEEYFVYRFTHSEFNLQKGAHRLAGSENAALNVACHQATGQVQLTMRDTNTVISVLTETDPSASGLHLSSGVLFSMRLWLREDVLRFVDSTCNSVVDQFGNDLSIDSATPLDPDHYMGDIRGSYCTDVNMVQGAFGLKDREQAWGWILGDNTGELGCASSLEKTYRTGFASVSAWSTAGFEVACNGTMPTSVSTTFSPDTTQLSNVSQITNASHISARVVGNKSALAINSDRTEGLTEEQRTVLGACVGFFLLDQVITQVWYFYSNYITQARTKYISQVSAAVLGFGLPLFQSASPCSVGMRPLVQEFLLLSKDQP
ncbi:hypothetical protein [Endozoicomonas sp. SESOKO2]|uniref:hypothetical protein n=2 Tax=unclassified Endozoicomonas TaxID=2644528 RepID=UPI002148EF12|nr:hypothetical protein [Endozoicomonas sp. SESOKO2]